MKISFVIPVYNVAEYLPKAVDSLLSQDLTDCEIILVDDGSTDGKSGEICDRYAERHPDFIRVIHKENGGLGDARNVGVSHATGDYIFFLDSDDYVREDTVSLLKKRIDETDADIIIFGLSVVVNGKTVAEQLDSIPSDRLVFTPESCPSLLMIQPNACNKLWKRSLLERTGIAYPKRVWYEDIRTVTKLLVKSDTISYLPVPLYSYVNREGSITKNSNVERNREIIDAFDDILSWFRENHLYERYAEQLEALTVFHVLLTASVRVARIDRKAPLLAEFRHYVTTGFPSYRRNKYLKTWSKPKRLALFLVEKQAYGLLAILFALKK